MPRGVRFWLGWWACLTALYVLLVFKTEPAEFVAGAVCGAISATGAYLVRQASGTRFHPGWGWLPAAARLPRAVIVDTIRLVGVLWRVIARREDVRGRIISLPYKDAHRRGVDAESRRAVAKFLGSVAPNTVVVGIAERHDRVLVHQLVPAEPPPPDPWEKR
jgi:hypothetical protein